MPALRGALNALLLGVNTLLAFTLMVPPALVKLLVPADRVRAGCDRLLNGLAGGWVAVNNAWIASACPAPWQVRGADGLNPRGWYLVSSNHQSWVDILVLQRVFHGRIPFLKFFLKRELIWVPVIGLAWWALDFPFMKRGRGTGRSDLATTRRSCEKFKRVPTAVINFVEGTRFSAAKQAGQGGRYRHLLEPRSGGLGVALQTLGARVEALLDVTIVYPDGTPSFWNLLCGDVRKVIVDIRSHSIDPGLIDGDYENDAAFRLKVQNWVNQLWIEKDRRIDDLRAGRP